MIDEKYKTVAGLLSSPARWCKGDYAQTETNKYALATSKEAVKFCLLGAIMVISKHQSSVAEKLKKAEKALHELFPDIRCNIVTWQDLPTTTHQQVLQVVKKAKI